MYERFGKNVDVRFWKYLADESGWIPIHYAAHLGNVNVVELVLKANNSLAYIKDNEGWSPLHISVRNGQSRVVKKLVEEQPDICELLDNKERKALHVAAIYGRRKVLEKLLDMAPFNDLLNEQDSDGNTCLHLTAIYGPFEPLELLAKDSRVDKGVINKRGMTAVDIMRSNSYDHPSFEIQKVRTKYSCMIVFIKYYDGCVKQSLRRRNIALLKPYKFNQSFKNLGSDNKATCLVTRS